MNGYKKLSVAVEIPVDAEPPAKVAKVAKVTAPEAEFPRGYRRFVPSDTDDPALLKFAKVANPGENAAAPAEPLTILGPHVPCSVCGGTDRWEDVGIWRCVACWPHPITRKTCEAERAYQRTSRVPRRARIGEGAAE